MKNKTKLISRRVTIIALVIAILISLSIPFAVLYNDLNKKIQSELNEGLSSAVVATNDYDKVDAGKKFDFNDAAFKKAEIVNTYIDENSKQEEVDELAKNLKLDSIGITDIEGKYIVASPKDLVGTKIKDNEDTVYLSRIVNNTTKKCVTEPKAVSDDGEKYKYYCGLERKKGEQLVGAVVIGETTTEYDEVLGSDIIYNCKEGAIIAKDGVIISSSLDNTNGLKLEEININEEDRNLQSTFTYNKTEYYCKAEKINEFSIIYSIPKDAYVFSINKIGIFIGAGLAALVVCMIVLFIDFKPRKDEDEKV